MSASIESTGTVSATEPSSLSSTSSIITTTVMQQPIDPPYKPVHRFKRMLRQDASHSFSRSNGTEAITMDTYDNKQPATPLPVTTTSSIPMPQSADSIIKSQNIFQRMISHLSTSSFVSVPQVAPMNGVRFLSNVAESSMSRREVAEIQLYAILNDPKKSLPVFAVEANVMSLEEVSKQLDTPSFLIERLLNVLNSLSGGDNSSLMSQKNVINLTRVLNGSMDVRVLLFFMMLDENGDDHVTRNEMSYFLELYLKSISFKAHHLQEAIQALLQRFHLETKTEIDFEEFYTIVTEDPIIVETLSGFTVNPRWFILPLSIPRSNVVQRCCANLCWYPTCYNRHKSKLTPEYFNNNLSRVIFLIFYILVNIALALYVVIYRSAVVKNSVFFVIAHVGAMLLYFNCTLIIVLMLKQTILFIRSNRLLRRWIPVDDHIDFHKFVGRFIVALVILHVTAHMINFSRLSDYSWATYMFTTIPGIGWVHGFTPISGLILSTVLAIIVIFSMDWIRCKGHFRIFYWTHRFYLVFFVLLIIHAKDFWKWIIVPLIWFFLEKLYSIVSRYSSRSGRTYLHSVTIEQSNVISLNIHRPKHFTFKPGDYININLPQVAISEFHPFTISSAPEEADILCVHIQAVGHWTKRVYKRFKDMSENNDGDIPHVKVYRADQGSERADGGERNDQNVTENGRNQNNIDNVTTASAKKEVVIINGPYSSCARYIFDCKHVVLISGGIGVTPYASILSSLMAQFRASRRICEHCQGTSYDRRIMLENHHIRKVDFIWVSRDHKTFEWFFNLLHQFELEQEAYLASNPNEHRFLTIHLYFTEIKSDEYIGYYPLQLITQVWSQVTGKDIFTGLKARTHIGRPPWNKIFTDLCSGENASRANDINVFFCGPSAMGTTINECCTEHNFHFYEEKF